MSEMVERVAAAVWDLNEDTDCHDYNELTLNAKERAKQLARAAITAMRHPTESMRKAGAPYLGATDIHFAWQAMIDAALGDPASEGGEG